MIQQKIKIAEALSEEAASIQRKGKRIVRPGDLVRYYFFHDIEGDSLNAILMSGKDEVVMTRNKEPRIKLRNIAQWLFSGDVMFLRKQK